MESKIHPLSSSISREYSELSISGNTPEIMKTTELLNRLLGQLDSEGKETALQIANTATQHQAKYRKNVLVGRLDIRTFVRSDGCIDRTQSDMYGLPRK